MPRIATDQWEVIMPLYCDAGVSVENWVEMKPDVTMKYEVDRHNDLVTLFFGGNGTFVLNVSRVNLAQIVELGTRALADLKVTEPGNHEDRRRHLPGTFRNS